jgi:hypothetical protein
MSPAAKMASAELGAIAKLGPSCRSDGREQVASTRRTAEEADRTKGELTARREGERRTKPFQSVYRFKTSVT